MRASIDRAKILRESGCGGSHGAEPEPIFAGLQPEPIFAGLQPEPIFAGLQPGRSVVKRFPSIFILCG